ncbi:hypothetical protein SLS60_007546 [Paraconiothyrium brasiliense]|uniref:Uncharacterized protein n=1 Tax=Paraconiothyrium brasiliense TaxID=300254 RepID=A0ABR3R6Z8_9PLEO
MSSREREDSSWIPMSRGGKHFSSKRFGDVSNASPLRARIGANGEGSGSSRTTAEEVLQGEIRTVVANPLQQRISTMLIEDVVKKELRDSVAEQVQRQIDAAAIEESVKAGVGGAMEDLSRTLRGLMTIEDSQGNPQPLPFMLDNLKQELKALHAATLSPPPCLGSNEDGSRCNFPADRPANWVTGPVNRCAMHAHLEYDHDDPKALGELTFWHHNGEGVHRDIEKFVKACLADADPNAGSEALHATMEEEASED